MATLGQNRAGPFGIEVKFKNNAFAGRRYFTGLERMGNVLLRIPQEWAAQGNPCRVAPYQPGGTELRDKKFQTEDQVRDEVPV